MDNNCVLDPVFLDTNVLIESFANQDLDNAGKRK